MTDVDRPWDPQPPKPKPPAFRNLSGRDKAVLGVAAAAIAVVVVGVFLSGDGSDSAPSDTGDRYGAIDVCHQRVEGQLKAPSTADYSDETATETSPGHWSVAGSVDAENSFGAKVRSTYTCEAVHTDGDNWNVTASVF
jgi:hypothetical protein